MRPLRMLARLAAALFWLASAALALLAALLLSAWLWTAQADSLPRTLGWLQGWLQQPDGSSPLLVREASGNLREGGRIGYLRWRRDGIEVELTGLELRWPASLWPDLALRHELHLDAIELDRLRLRDDGPAASARTAPDDLLPPWLRSVRLPLSANRIVIEGRPNVELGKLRADYRFGSRSGGEPMHSLQVHALHWADGDYRLQASLQAKAPMKLVAGLQGEVQTRVPGGNRQSLSASASLEGELGGPQAALALAIEARPAVASRPSSGLRASALISPWSDRQLPAAELDLDEIDLSAFWPQAPRTRLQGRWRAGRGADGAGWRLKGELRNLAPGHWTRGALPLLRLRAELTRSGDVLRLQQLDADLLEGGRLQAAGSWREGKLLLDHAELALAGARASASGELGLGAHQLKGMLALPGASASMRAVETGGTALLTLIDAQRLQHWMNRDLGRWLPPAALDVLQPGPLRGALLNGSGTLTADWSGPLRADMLPQSWQAGLDLPSLRILWPADQARAPLQLSRWRIALAGSEGQATLQIDGAASSGGWSTSAKLGAQAMLDREQPGRAAELTLQTAELQVSDPLRMLSLRLDSGARLIWPGGDRLTLAPGRAGIALQALAGKPATRLAELSWEASHWSGGRLTSRGSLSGLDLAWLDLLLAGPGSEAGSAAHAGLSGDLALQAGWELDLPLQPARSDSQQASARVEIGRSKGDISLLWRDADDGMPQPVGLEQANASLTLDGTQLRARLRWNSRLAGRLDADLATDIALPTPGRPEWSWPAESRLAGRLQASLPRLDPWSRWAPPGWRINGKLQADALLGGTRIRPEWQGKLQADDLALRSLVDGLDFSGGELRATLAGEQIRLDSLKLRGAGGAGLLLGHGSLRWPQAETTPDRRPSSLLPAMAIDLEARQLSLLARADRRLTLSGHLSARTDGRLLDVSGRLQADQALLILPDEDRPTLGEDVVVRGRSQTTSHPVATALPLRLQLELALGDDFRLRGQGLDTLLAGELRLGSSPGQDTPQLVGQLHTRHGRYRAWGQTLEIEEGLLNFSGPYDNPGLDILALRPLADQRVGVKLRGTALAPRLQLYSDPELPESEKLAWLVLGRPASGAGTEAALLQQAALALIGRRGIASDGGLQRALGLDEISFRGETQKTDGSSSAAALTLGKRISRQLYLSYSRSVIGTTGTVALLYDLTRQLTLRAKAGDDNALELVFTRRYDSLFPPSRASGR